MKRNGDIASLFRKHAAKKAVVASSPSLSPATMVAEDEASPTVPLDDVSPPPPPPPPPPVYDINRLPHDPGERLPIQNYPVNDQDAIRRAYILKGPFQPYAHDFPKRKIGNRDRQFNFVWFHKFDFVFSAHLMLVILGYTNDLSECLQRREQDILNAISLVSVAKSRMQQLRSNGWNQFLQRVTMFCNKHGVQVPDMEGNYVPYGRSIRFARNQPNDDHFRREVYIGVIDQISQELDNRFDEVNIELLSCMSAFNPTDSFASFDAQKVRRLAEFYPNDIISSTDLIKLELQLDNYIDDIRQDDRFKGLHNLVDLSVKLVETKRHIVYDLVYMLLKLVLLLPVATASVERVFSAMSFVKSKLRNKMGDSFLDDCLVTFIERDIFFEVDADDIIKSFMAIRRRRPNKK